MSKKNQEISAVRLRELISYESSTGRFTWTKRRCGVKFDDIAGSFDSHGYLRISIEGRRYKAHRLAWLYVHGRWPKDQLDHINGIRSDNRIENLREATNAENRQNAGIRRDNTSGQQGVSWDKKRGKWMARIQMSGRSHYLGSYYSLESAVASYKAAKAKIHEFQPSERGAGI